MLRHLTRSARLNATAFNVALLAAALSASGCGNDTPSQPPPEVFAVSGTVTDKAGQPVTAGMLEFRAAAGAESSAKADIQTDGSFSLYTLFEGEKLAGAAAGEYHVTFYPKMSEAQTELPVSLNDPFIVENKDNVFEVQLP